MDRLHGGVALVAFTQVWVAKSAWRIESARDFFDRGKPCRDHLGDFFHMEQL
jgi:hypothetical protein